MDAPEDFVAVTRNQAIRNAPALSVPFNNATRTILNSQGYRQQFC
jgi:hypothetical protein